MGVEISRFKVDSAMFVSPHRVIILTSEGARANQKRDLSGAREGEANDGELSINL